MLALKSGAFVFTGLDPQATINAELQYIKTFYRRNEAKCRVFSSATELLYYSLLATVSPIMER